jgi:hypothetical protein
MFMFKLIKKSKKRLSQMQHGQVLVIVALAITGIVAIMGLALDVGSMLIEYARLRRAVDSAALAAALQIREGYDPADLAPAARDFLKLNGFDTNLVTVEYCDLITHTPADLCPTPPRKLVRVWASATAQLNFLAVIGIRSVPIAATATSQTASIDMVLVIDRSESMTYYSAVGQKTNGVQMRDPSVCNAAATSPQGYVGDCEPFNTVKDSAIKFVNKFMFEPYDRVSVVTFDKDPHVNLNFESVKATVISTIAGLTVYQGDESGGVTPGIYPYGNPSRYYDPVNINYGPPDNPNGKYLGFNCPMALIPNDSITNPFFHNPSQCTTTNLGGGLLHAAQEFSTGTPRLTSLWVVVLLTDGAANAGYDTSSPPTYFCPAGTWITDPNHPPYCNDGTTDIIPANRHSPMASPLFDAEDYAYYEADMVGLPTEQGGQNAYLYTIGLGPEVTNLSPVDGTPLGENFLKYAAGVGNGRYYRAPTASDLNLIFQSIANNIATVLTK